MGVCLKLLLIFLFSRVGFILVSRCASTNEQLAIIDGQGTALSPASVDYRHTKCFSVHHTMPGKQVRAPLP